MKREPEMFQIPFISARKYKLEFETVSRKRETSELGNFHVHFDIFIIFSGPFRGKSRNPRPGFLPTPKREAGEKRKWENGRRRVFQRSDDATFSQFCTLEFLRSRNGDTLVRETRTASPGKKGPIKKA